MVPSTQWLGRGIHWLFVCKADIETCLTVSLINVVTILVYLPDMTVFELLFVT